MYLLDNEDNDENSLLPMTGLVISLLGGLYEIDEEKIKLSRSKIFMTGRSDMTQDSSST